MTEDKAEAFAYYWRVLAGDSPAPVREHRFATALGRQWRFDFAWPDFRIAVEIDGGNYMARKTADGRSIAVGRHTKDDDYEKRNAASELRWLVFSFTTEMLKKDPQKCIGQIVRVLAAEA